MKTRPVLKRAWQGISKEGCPNWKISWGHNEGTCCQIRTKKHDFFHDPMTSTNMDILPCHNVFKTGFVFTVAKKKIYIYIF